MWLPGTYGVKERRRRANQQRGICRMRKDEEIQQKPTTIHQAGKQGVNRAASPGLGAKTEGEVGQIWRSLQRINLAQTVDPEKSPPNPAGRGCWEVPAAPSSWVRGVQGDWLGWQGRQCWTGVHLALTHHFYGLSTQLHPKLEYSTLGIKL